LKLPDIVLLLVYWFKSQLSLLEISEFEFSFSQFVTDLIKIFSDSCFLIINGFLSGCFFFFLLSCRFRCFDLLLLNLFGISSSVSSWTLTLLNFFLLLKILFHLLIKLSLVSNWCAISDLRFRCCHLSIIILIIVSCVDSNFLS